MEEKKIQRLLSIKGLSTVFYSRILFKEIYDFNEKNIVSIKHKHCQVGFEKCLLSPIEGEIFMFYNSEGYYTDPIHPDYWKILYKKIKECNLFIEEHKESDKIHVFKFKFPEKLMNDFQLILEGKYSKLSKKYMEYYPDNDSLLYHLYHKTSDIKKGYSEKFKIPIKIFDEVDEIGPKINTDSEIYKVNFGINV